MCGDWLPIEAVHVDEVCRERVHTRHMRRRSVRHERRRRRLVRRVLDVGGGLQARVVGALLRLVRLFIALLLDPFLLSLLAKVVLVREDLRARATLACCDSMTDESPARVFHVRRVGVSLRLHEK